MNPGKAFTHVKTLAKLFILLGVILVFNWQPAGAEHLQQAYDCSAQTDIPQAECEALVALYNSTNGSGWIDSTDWLKTTNPCGWAGVTCGSGAVTALDLNGNNLVGFIPGTIDSLSKLTLLDLSGNKLSGALPGEIGNIASLLTLNISANPGLTGSLPANLTSLGVLTTFDFGSTNLCEPQDVAFQTWLSGLSGTGTGIPCFQGCALQTSVSEPECNALVSLYNSTTGASWTDSTNWEYSDDVCTWYGVTCGSGAVTELTLNDNNLVGVIPIEIGNLSSLALLNFSNNKLSGGLPGEIGNITPLNTLNVSSNTGLTGSLPANLTSLGVLTTFDFGSTGLCEPQDAAFQTWLSGLSGTGTGIPCFQGCTLQTSVSEVECNALISLYNNTSGDSWTDKTNWLFSDDVCTWNGLTCGSGAVISLNLNGNNLVGGIPTDIDNLSNLDILDIGNNSGLTGSLPGTMTNLSVLDQFVFSGTGLCVPQDSSFQAWLATLSYLESTSIPCYDCASQSSVPQAECEALVALYTSTNGDNWLDHSGWFSSDVCSWKGVSCFGGYVVEIDLTYNNLTGTIPPEIGDFPYLFGLYLGGSPISGSLPAELGNLNNLIDLWVYETNISGSIPISLGNLSQLEGLRLSSNQLNGSLPAEIGSMVNLVAFGVDNNNLSGTLPPELGNLTFLEFLDVRNNSFTGEIPGPFVNLINLLEFHNDNNALCMPNNNTALINWYQALDFGSLIYYCDPIIVTNTPKPTATSSGGGSGTSPTSTSLPTNTPTITFTPTITLTPTLVAPLQTLTQMAIEDTQAADPSNGQRTATTAASATLYYFYQQGTETVEPGVLSDANGGSGLTSEDDNREGQSGTLVAGTQAGMFIPPPAVWFAIIMAVILIVGILIFDRRKRKKDPA